MSTYFSKACIGIWQNDQSVSTQRIWSISGKVLGYENLIKYEMHNFSY